MCTSERSPCHTVVVVRTKISLDWAFELGYSHGRSVAQMAEKRNPVDHSFSMTGEAVCRLGLYIFERIGCRWQQVRPEPTKHRSTSVDCIEAFADRRIGLRIPSSRDLSDIASVLEERLRPAVRCLGTSQPLCDHRA